MSRAACSAVCAGSSATAHANRGAGEGSILPLRPADSHVRHRRGARTSGRHRETTRARCRTDRRGCRRRVRLRLHGVRPSVPCCGLFPALIESSARVLSPSDSSRTVRLIGDLADLAEAESRSHAPGSRRAPPHRESLRGRPAARSRVFNPATLGCSALRPAGVAALYPAPSLALEPHGHTGFRSACSGVSK